MTVDTYEFRREQPRVLGVLTPGVKRPGREVDH